VENVEVRLSAIIKHFQGDAQVEQVVAKVILDYIPTPQRSKRVLLDQYHSLKYPENGYILRDSLLNADYPYEWNGDHIYTNYVQMHQKLVESGFYVEVLTEPYSCFDPLNYQSLLIIDPEDYFSQAEIVKLRHDFEWQGLSLIIIADWYN
jgi:membrane-bound transcription factor site-1 protease